MGADWTDFDLDIIEVEVGLFWGYASKCVCTNCNLQLNMDKSLQTQLFRAAYSNSNKQ